LLKQANWQHVSLKRNSKSVYWILVWNKENDFTKTLLAPWIMNKIRTTSQHWLTIFCLENLVSCLHGHTLKQHNPLYTSGVQFLPSEPSLLIEYHELTLVRKVALFQDIREWTSVGRVYWFQYFSWVRVNIKCQKCTPMLGKDM
jgi:hypothetical protein